MKLIEARIKNDLTLKRWRSFKKNRRAVFSSWILLVLVGLSLTSELWSNSKPIVMSKGGTWYFPIVKDYHPTEFGIKDLMVTDYRMLRLHDGDWAIWPLVEWDPFESNKRVDTYPSPPSEKNWLGTDDRGRDVLSRLLYGFRYSFSYAVLVWVITSILGIILGGIMGFTGGWVDLIGQRVVEVISSVPYLFLLIILVSIFTPGLMMLVALTCFFGWIFMASYIRAEFLKNRRREYVEAARALGASRARLIFKHILPNSLVPLITFSPFLIATQINALAALDYLGFGLSPPTPSWGELLAQAQKNFIVAWWLAAFPALALFTTLVLLALIGDGIREAWDPNK